jgi:hypothetical protein
MHTKNHVIAVKRNDIQVDDKVLRANDNVGVGADRVASNAVTIGYRNI